MRREWDHLPFSSGGIGANMTMTPR
jgi:hypothetical protein